MQRFVFLLLLATLPLSADELTKSVQTDLKELGFYYGEVTGLNSPETAAAIKRYQIRNGFEVTGTLTKETLQGLGLAGDEPPPATPTPAPVAPPKQQPPVNLRRDDSVAESDRDFLRQENRKPRVEAEGRPSAAPSAAPGSSEYAAIFARTPYEIAPAEVQVSTLRKAQNILARSGYYRDPVDGQPGPSTEEAVLSYQRRLRLPMTGRLDIETLAAMALLPGRGNGPAMRPSSNPPSSRTTRPLRGVWVN